MKCLLSTVVLLTLPITAAADPPRHVLERDGLKLTVLLPDAQTGFYRGTRFDWSGVVEKAEVNGHTLLPPWLEDE